MGNPNIIIEYDGGYPNLCSGTLKVTIDRHNIPLEDVFLSSGGSVSFDDEWNEEVSGGDWSVDFPDGWGNSFIVSVIRAKYGCSVAELEELITDAINSEVENGCCGGCV